MTHSTLGWWVWVFGGYKKLKARLGAIGAGVLPGNRHANLLLEICAKWKWFADLDAIWHSNPAFAVTSHSSRPGVDHAGQMYSLVQPPHGTAATGTSRHSRDAARVQPQASCSASTQSFHGDPPIDPYLLQPSPALPDTPATPTPPDDIPDIPDPVTPHYDPPPQDNNMMQDNNDGMQDNNDEMQDETTLLSAQLDGSKKKKKAKSDMQDQVENLTEEIRSIQSDVMSLCDSKHQQFIVKLEAKSENQCETKKYNWLHDTRAHEASQAVLTHQ
ncbi:hypothetical protein DFH29DRAFT_871299 [Suillus ampliporus]|nr:hypothetical protein DFH29DRAFT_871299 [Suillus ampliporus]